MESQKNISPTAHRPAVSVVSLFRKLLVVACFALGAALAWGISEYRARGHFAGEARSAQQNYHVILARQAEWGQLVAQPATQMLHLRGQGEWTGKSAALAWNSDRRAGVMFLPPLPPTPSGTTYHLWLRSSNERTIYCGAVEVTTGGGMVLMRTDEKQEGAEFFITAEKSRSPTAPSEVRLMSSP